MSSNSQMSAEQYDVLIRRMKVLSKTQTAFIKSHLYKKLESIKALIIQSTVCLENVAPGNANNANNDMVTQAQAIKKALSALKLEELNVDIVSKEIELAKELHVLRRATGDNIYQVAPGQLFDQFGNEAATNGASKDDSSASVFDSFAPSSSPVPAPTGNKSDSTDSAFPPQPPMVVNGNLNITPSSSTSSAAEIAALMQEITILKAQVTESVAGASVDSCNTAATTSEQKQKIQEAVTAAVKKTNESWETRLQKLQDNHDKALAAKNMEILGLSNQIGDLIDASNGSDALLSTLTALESQLKQARTEKIAAEAEVLRVSEESKINSDTLIKAAGERAEARALQVMLTADTQVKEANNIAEIKLKDTIDNMQKSSEAAIATAIQQISAEKDATIQIQLQNLRQELTLEHTELQEKRVLAAIAETEERLEAEKEEMMEAMAQEVEELESTKDEIISELNGSLDMMKSDVEKGRQRIAIINSQKEEVESKLSIITGNNSKLRSNLAILKGNTQALQREYQSLLATMKQELNEMKINLKNQYGGKIINNLKNVVKEIQYHKERYNKEYTERKKLHNLVQELKGNIRVYMRCRPASRKERDELGDDSVCVSYPTAGQVRVYNDKNREKSWEFDETFDLNSTQEQVYTDVSALVTSVMDGYNVCIFAYGQTGSGKTHTMSGTATDRGVNWRALDELFQKCDTRCTDIRDTICLSILEVYNEEIRDLLGAGYTHTGDKLEIRQGEFGNYVPGLTQCKVTTLRDVEELFSQAERNRSTATTNMNDQSSRSHMLLSISIVSENISNGITSRGKLNLVDLAGSERLNRSGAAGQALKEAQNINKSLSALGDVIAARASKASHIPFRNSTLTHLLQDSLSKDSKTLMICCISPTLDSAEETYCSLNFAARVRTVELGKATKNAPIAGGGGAKGR